LSLDTLKLVAENGPKDYKDHPVRKFKEWQKMGPGGLQLYQGEVDEESGRPDGRGVMMFRNQSMTLSHFKNGKYHGGNM